MRNPYIVGKHVYLRTLEEADARGEWYEWFSDIETTKYMSDRYWPNSEEEQVEFQQSLKGRDRLALAVVDIETDKHIGVASLAALNWVHRYGDVALVIGDKEFRKGAYAFETLSLMLKIAFLKLNLRNVKGSYVKGNEFTETLLKVMRFKTIGSFEGLCWVDGDWRDVVYGCLGQDDWMKRNGHDQSA